MTCMEDSCLAGSVICNGPKRPEAVGLAQGQDPSHKVCDLFFGWSDLSRKGLGLSCHQGVFPPPITG